MQKHRQITLNRIRKFASEKGIKKMLYPRRAPVTLSVYHAPGRIPFDQAFAGTYEPAHVGQVFGPVWSTHWFKVEIVIPSDWRDLEVHLLWDSSSEACVWSDGVPLQGLTGSKFQDSKPIRSAYPLTPPAKVGETMVLYIEMACNWITDAKIPDEYPLKQAEIAIFDRRAWDLLWDFTIIAEMADHLPENTPRAGQALHTANAMINVCDLGNPDTWSKARYIAAAFFAEANGASQHNLSAIGNAHIDTAWLWPLAETKRKCVRTFSTALRLMEDYPEYKFACSQAQQFVWIKESHPELYAQIKSRVADGRFIPVGGMWVEPDCNIPSGESLVRQFLYGQRFFQDEFGITCRQCWIPDVFGYPASLPQIIRGAQIEHFITQKLSWNEFNPPANHTFYWEGLDGSQVLAHFPPVDTYVAFATVEQVLYNISNFKEHDRARESFMLFGHGDGGGGPTAEMLERIRRMSDVDGLPRMQIRSPGEFFERCQADIKGPVTWVGELYFEYHRGTYTTHAATKRDNRRSEELLHDIELLSVLAHIMTASPYPTEKIDHLWKLVLLNQFHDILPGSSIQKVYQDSAKQYTDVLSSGAKLRHQALTALVGDEDGENILALNTTSEARQEVVELPFEFPTSQHAANGSPLALVEAPPLGYAIQTFEELEKITLDPVRLTSIDGELHLENKLVRACFTPDGRLVSFIDKRLDREAIAPGTKANNLVMFADSPPKWDAWDVSVYHLETRVEVPPATSARIIESGPLRAAIEFEYQLTNSSRLMQTIYLTCNSPRLDFATEVDWQESERFLKVEFPINVRSEKASFEIQFGHVERPTHFNTPYDLARFEVSAHRWADLSETGFGVALLNDSKYGYSTHGKMMRLSLLRSPKEPDPQADIGGHTFRYALLPHSGNFQEAKVVAEGYHFNYPIILRKAQGRGQNFSLFQINRPGVVIDTVKKAEDSDDIILRLYESHGGRGPLRITSPLSIRSAWRCDLLEENDVLLQLGGRGLNLDIKPFEIVTLKLQVDTTQGLHQDPA